MPIKEIKRDGLTGAISSTKIFFQNRVFKVEVVEEERNHSGTLDYSDYRNTRCTYALVWLGPRGVPPYKHPIPRFYTVGPKLPRQLTHLTPCSWEIERDLEPHEQWAWVDCTNLFGDFQLDVEVDPFPMLLAFHGPRIIDSFRTWVAEQEAAQAKIVEDYNRAREAERLAKEQEKEADEAAYDAAHDLIVRAPKKGTTVTVDGFTGQVFWTGVKKYRGTWGARAGIKSQDGKVIWVDAAKFA